MTRAARRWIALVSLAAAAAALPAAAQQFRFGGTTVGQVIQLPTLVMDSIAAGSTAGSGTFRATPDGHVAWCQPGNPYCYYQRSGGVVTTEPLTQDLEVNAFGFGEGLRVYAQVRLRATGGSQVWPLADQTFSTIAAFLEYDRTALRARLGRQFEQNGLGYYNYDGLSALWRAAPWIDAEIYGGGALMEALNAPYTSSLVVSTQDPAAPNDNAWLIGTRVRMRGSDGSSLAVLFQLIDRNDNRGLYSERIALNGLLHAGPTQWTADVTMDLATGNFNLAQARGTLPVGKQTGVFVEGRHFVPYFDLWSIWSVFSPVGYNELNAGGYWHSPLNSFSATLTGGMRYYENADAGTGSLTTNGWRVGADLTWQASPTLALRGGYHYDIGPGAAMSDGNLFLRYDASDEFFTGLFLTGFQTAYEYQQGYGTVAGGGITGGIKIADWGQIAADVGEYRNTYGGNAPQSDWDQFRASLRFEFMVGKEPGYTGTGVVR